MRGVQGSSAVYRKICEGNVAIWIFRWHDFFFSGGNYSARRGDDDKTVETFIILGSELSYSRQRQLTRLEV